MDDALPLATSPFLEGNFGPVSDEVAADALTVIGAIPDGLEGYFLRNGPNPQFAPRGGYHWFAGDGMVHAVRFDRGRASYRNRWVRTEGFEKERAAGRALWTGEFGAPDFDNPNGPSRGNTANTALVLHDRRLLALWEAGEPYQLSLPDLGTIGPHTFDGALSHAFTAHPKIDPETGKMHFFGYGLFGPPYLHYSVVGTDGAIEHTTPIELPSGVMMHDFALSARHVIFMDLPYTFSLERAMRGENPFAWEPERGARFGVLPLGAPGESIRWFHGPACFVFHTLNAYDDGDTVVLEACRMPSLDLFDLAGDFGAKDNLGRLHRWRFDLTSGAMREEPLDDARADFPRIADTHMGRKARYGYCARYGGDGAMSDAVIKYDLHTGRSAVHQHGAFRSGGEAVFVPRPDARSEDDGWLVTFVYDAREGRSECVVLDAQEITAAPVARIVLPQRVPYGFHGLWVPESQAATLR